jgi:hypothetical protein
MTIESRDLRASTNTYSCCLICCRPGPSGGVDAFVRAESRARRIHIRFRSKQQGVGVMIENNGHDSSVSSPAESLKILLDYAIAEGTELHLPVLVLLLRMANLELAKSARRTVCLNSDSPSLQDAGELIAP